jgi:hypothetical protein
MRNSSQPRSGWMAPLVTASRHRASRPGDNKWHTQPPVTYGEPHIGAVAQCQQASPSADPGI